MRILRVLLVVAMLFVGACGGDDDDASTTSTTAASGSEGEADVNDLAAKAATITDQYVANDWPALRADFDATMEAGLSEAMLAEGWTQVVAMVGAYTSRDEPVEVPKDDAHVVYDTPMHFERGDMKCRVAFNLDGTIAGLFILKPEAP